MKLSFFIQVSHSFISQRDDPWEQRHLFNEASAPSVVVPLFSEISFHAKERSLKRCDVISMSNTLRGRLLEKEERENTPPLEKKIIL